MGEQSNGHLSRAPGLTGYWLLWYHVTMKKTRVRPAALRLETNSKEYWEQVLKDEGLSMNAGLDPGHRKLLRVGGTADLERIHAAIVSYTGKVKPAGHGPDDAPDSND